MLTRIYVDNYKSLVNFEMKVGQINLLLGPNGTGKSSVFEVLRKLRAFIGGEKQIQELFDNSTRTRWQTSRIQTFEIDVRDDQGNYRYELAVEHDELGQKMRVKRESLSLDGNPLLRFEQGEMRLFRDDYSEGPQYPFNWLLSAVGSILPRGDNRKLTRFKQKIQKLLIAQSLPALMGSESNQEESTPSDYLENFVSWYRYISQEDQGLTVELTGRLREILPGFDRFGFEAYGERNRRLKAYFSRATAEGAENSYAFDELSDGQKNLIVLYAILIAAQRNGYILCLDEPENFLALPEIRPWLAELYNLCDEGKIQALLISHHPEMIDYLLASPIGYWFERQDNLSTRTRTIGAAEEDGLSISELIARGWLYE